jgi:hypothetical protein
MNWRWIMKSKCIYFVEGECEKQLINVLKISPEILTPGKVKVYNVKQNLIPKSQLLAIQPRTKVALVFDTDVEDRKALDKNIEMLRKYCSNVTVVNMMQVLDFEDEIVRSTDVSKAQELTKSRSVSNFKTDFCRMKVSDCRSLLERHQFDIKEMWTIEPPPAFKDLKQEAYKVIIATY